MINNIYTFITLFILSFVLVKPVFGSKNDDQYSCMPKHAAAIRSNGIQVFEIKGNEKPVYVSIKDGYLKTNDMKYKLYEAGGRAFAFSEERAWVHFQDITILDNGKLSFAMAVNSSISRYLCDKK